MTKPTGFFELRTPSDLFRKAEADLIDLETSYQDTRKAFNFFLTVHHLADWLSKGRLRKEHACLRVVSQVANGGKHFELDDERHNSVTAMEKSRYVEEGYVAAGYVEEPLIIHLTTQEEKELGIKSVDAITLGKMALEFWRPFVEANNP